MLDYLPELLKGLHTSLTLTAASIVVALILSLIFTRLRQFACPGQPVQEKEPPVRGEPACGSLCAPVSRRRKRSRPLGANPPAAVRVPRSAGAGKGAAR